MHSWPQIRRNGTPPLVKDFNLSRSEALDDFHRAQHHATIMWLWSRLRGEVSELYSYEAVRRQLRARESSKRIQQDVPLDAIVGSVGRYQEFTRGFLPRGVVRGDRWVRVKLAMTGMRGVPPIEAYRIGDAYFVQDGNHRVSVAREMGLKHIPAFVTEVESRVHLGPDVRPDRLIVAAEKVEFLERTSLDLRRPETDLDATVPGAYPSLLEHISVHRYFMGLDSEPADSFEAAADHWYDHVYLPVLKAIRELKIMQEFPGRTEVELYLWLSHHRTQLERSAGHAVSPAAAALDLVTSGYWYRRLRFWIRARRWRKYVAGYLSNHDPA